jgi:hypothetical protein
MADGTIVGANQTAATVSQATQSRKIRMNMRQGYRSQLGMSAVERPEAVARTRPFAFGNGVERRASAGLARCDPASVPLLFRARSRHQVPARKRDATARGQLGSTSGDQGARRWLAAGLCPALRSKQAHRPALSDNQDCSRWQRIIQ